MSFTFDPKAQTGAYGSPVILMANVRIQIFRVEDRIGIILPVAQPFRGSSKTGVILVAQVVGIISASAQPVFEIEATHFIIILNGLWVVLLLFQPFPGHDG